MSKKKTFTLILAIIALVFSMNLIKSTYAKYVSSADSSTNSDIARWDILVNEKNIKNSEAVKTTLGFKFDNEWEGEKLIADDKIAPTRRAYLDVCIDPTNVDLAFNYVISVLSTQIKDIKLESYEIYEVEENTMEPKGTPKETVKVTTDNTNISRDWKPSKDKKPFLVRVYIIWDDDEETQDLEDEQDSIKGNTVDKEKLNLKLRFAQIKQTRD